MGENAVVNPAIVETRINQVPIISEGEQLVNPDLLQAQAEQAVNCLVGVDYSAVRGSCSDERKRKGLRNGQNTEPRPDVFGGPDIYALSQAELIGYFEDETQTGEDRLRAVKRQLNEAGLLSGGHDGCAANAGFGAVMSLIASSPDDMKSYVSVQLGDRYDESVADELIGNAAQAVQSGRYAAWQEQTLGTVYGQEAGEAIEQLEDMPHEAITLIRNRLPNTTVDQTELCIRSAVGVGSFIIDDAYADRIEHVFAAGPDAVRQKLKAEHAREMNIKAIARAVPNPELYQIDLLPS